MGFVAAVETLCGEPGAVVAGAFKRQQKENIQKPFSLPEKNRCGRAMVSYLQGAWGSAAQGEVMVPLPIFPLPFQDRGDGKRALNTVQ